MSIVVDPLRPHKYPDPPRKYPDWLAARLRGENVAVPESVLEENRPKIEPWMTVTATPGKILGSEPIPAAKYVPPPMVVQQRAKIPVKFKVLSIEDRPIFGFRIRANSEDLITDAKGEAQIIVYQGHDLSWSTGRESGWSIPVGAKRRSRMFGMVPMAQNIPINTPTTILVYPESGEFKVNGKTYDQLITYTTS